MVVAVIALVAAVAGTAVAGPGATSSKITKKKVTKIAGNVADQRISARESSLRVAHANTADEANHAATATQATNATNAEKAGDADALSGNTVVAEGDLQGPGGPLNTSVCSGDISTPAPGVQPGDHIVLTPPAGSWGGNREVTLIGWATADTVHYELCNQGASTNFGTAPPVRFLVIR
jgi:hypothetical protein